MYSRITDQKNWHQAHHQMKRRKLVLCMQVIVSDDGFLILLSSIFTTVNHFFSRQNFFVTTPLAKGKFFLVWRKQKIFFSTIWGNSPQTERKTKTQKGKNSGKKGSPSLFFFFFSSLRTFVFCLPLLWEIFFFWFTKKKTLCGDLAKTAKQTLLGRSSILKEKANKFLEILLKKQSFSIVVPSCLSFCFFFFASGFTTKKLMRMLTFAWLDGLFFSCQLKTMNREQKLLAQDEKNKAKQESVKQIAWSLIWPQT